MLDHLDLSGSLPEWEAIEDRQKVVNQLLWHSIGSIRVTPVECAPAPIEISIDSSVNAPVEEKSSPRRKYSYRFTCKCWQCGIEFPCATSKRRTCSDLCKSRLKNGRQKVQKVEQDLLWMLGDLQRLVDTSDPVQKRKAKTALVEVLKQVRMTCQEVGVIASKP